MNCRIVTARQVLRAVLTSIAILLAAPSLLVLGGGFLPDAPVLGRLAALVGEGLPWLFATSAAAVGAAVLAVRLGPPTSIHRAVFAGALLPLVAGIIVTGQVMVAAASAGATIDWRRAAFGPESDGGGPPGAGPGPFLTVTFAVVERRELRADIWIAPSGMPNATAGAGAPVVVYVHGGGFVDGGLRSRPALFAAFAAAGIVVVDVEYRLAPPPRWDQAGPDVRCALGWVAAHASDLGIDAGRIAIAGDSAGGNLALLAGYGAADAAAAAAGTAKATVDESASSCDGSAPIPIAVIAIAPAADLAAIWADRSIQAAGVPFPEAYIGGPPDEFPERYRLASPANLIRAGLPPTLIVQGSIDHLVAPRHAVALARLIRGAGVECSFLSIPFAEHGFEAAQNGYGAQILEQVLPAFVRGQAGGAAPALPSC